MQFFRISKGDINFTSLIKDLEMLLVETDDHGIARREIGMNNAKHIIHKYPNEAFPYGQYGLLDGTPIDLTSFSLNKISQNEFESLWHNTTSA